MGNNLDKNCRKNPNTHFTFSNLFSKIAPFFEKMLNNVVKTERPQMTSQYGPYALHAG